MRQEVFLPILAAGAALAAVGTGLSIAASNADQSAINAARNASNQAEAGFQRKASNVFQTNLPNNTADKARADITKGQQERTNVFNNLKQLATPVSPVANPNQTPEQQAMARTSMAGNAWSNVVNNNAAKMGGYGDWSTALGVKNQDVNNRLGVINNEAQGTARLLPLEIQVASHKGDALGSWGKIIGAIGSLAMSGAAAAPADEVGAYSGP